MITVELLGIDSYLAQDLCKDVHEGLANMYETKAEDILFFAPESFLIYKGLEQTSYRLNIVVEAPNKYLPLEKKVADYLMKVFSESHIHVHVLFRYFSTEHEYELLNENYPPFMTEENIAHFDTEEDVEHPYMGNAFEDYEERVKEHDEKMYKEDRERIEKEHDHDCGCHHNHE